MATNDGQGKPVRVANLRAEILTRDLQNKKQRSKYSIATVGDTAKILSSVNWLQTGFGLVIVFIAHLQLGITSNYKAAQMTVTH
jgi:hypothetical protein